MKPFLFIVLFTLSIVSNAQQSKVAERTTPNFNVQVTQAVFLGKTKPVSELMRLKTTSDEKRALQKAERKVPDNFIGRKKSKVIFPEREHQGPDPLVQGGGGPTYMVEPTINMDGIGDFGSPHDPTGDVGLEHYVQAVNVTEVGVYTKEGVLLDQFAMATLWADLGANSAGDPIVLYDETAGRWLVTEFTDPANLLVAVSETSDPLGSYFAYSFATPQFPDYPKYSIWPDAYLLTTNESGGGLHTQYFIDRNAMLAGNNTVTIQRIEVEGNNNTEQGFFVSTPIDWDGAALPDMLPSVMSLDDSSWGNAPEDAVRIISFDVDFANVNNTTVSEISLVTTPYDSHPCSVSGFGFQCVPQQGGGGLDAVPETIMNVPKYRNFGTHESIVCCFVTDVTDGANLAGVRWMEMRREPAGEWYVYQEGTQTGTDGYDRYMGSIAIDTDGNIGLGFTVSSENKRVSLRYTGRYASDPLGMMTVTEYEAVTGTGAIQSGGRYGDYSQMGVDPVDGNTFWFTSEYARSGGSGVGTRIVAFMLAQDTFDLALSHIISPVTAGAFTASELLTIDVTNMGLEPMANYTLSFTFQGTELESVVIPGPLNPDAVYTHTFTVPMDMSANGAYEITATVSHPDDTGEFNNMLSATVENLYSLDAAASFELGGVSCSPSITIPLTIFNQGAEVLVNGNINIYINGTLSGTQPWTGSIAYGLQAIVNVIVTGLVDGNNDITLEFVNPNGSPDESPLDNAVTHSINAILDGVLVEILIHTDNYAEETTWNLEDEAGNEILSGGPYATDLTDFSQIACLELNGCYTFTINDAYGDGICCGFGQGFYEISDAGGLIASGGDFGDSETVNFCVDNCTLSANIDITTDSGLDDGALFITAMNGVSGYQYSIDGGVTFQNNPLFSNLPAGTYNVVVLSGDGICEYTETVIILLVGLDELVNEINAVVKPNPTDGFFTIELTGVPSGDYMMHYHVLNSAGQLVQDRTMSRYNGVFTSRVSLLSEADGIYYIRFINEHVNQLLRVVKKS